MIQKPRLKRWIAYPKLTIWLVCFVVLVGAQIYWFNERLTPTYLRYAEVQTNNMQKT